MMVTHALISTQIELFHEATFEDNLEAAVTTGRQCMLTYTAETVSNM